MTKKPASKTSAPAFVVGDSDEQYRTPDFDARIVGVTYPVYVPKSTASIALARQFKTGKNGKIKEGDRAETIDAIMEWVNQAFEESDSDKIQARLKDPRDKLDIEHLTEFMQKVTEYQTEDTENPTT